MKVQFIFIGALILTWNYSVFAMDTKCTSTAKANGYSHERALDICLNVSENCFNSFNPGGSNIVEASEKCRNVDDNCFAFETINNGFTNTIAITKCISSPAN